MLRAISPFVVVAASVGSLCFVGCGEESKIGAPCEDVGPDEVEICEGTQLLRCDGNGYRVLAPCHHDCVEGTGTVHAQGEVGTSETWTCVGSPHLVQGVVTVANGATLTIEPGSEVRLLPSTHVTIAEGARVVVDAAAGSEVLFTSDNELAGGFGTSSTGGLNVFSTGDAAPSILRGLIVERGQNGITVSGLSSRSEEHPVIERSTFRDNTRFGILVNCEGVDVEVPDYAASGNQFFSNAGGAVSTCTTP